MTVSFDDGLSVGAPAVALASSAPCVRFGPLPPRARPLPDRRHDHHRGARRRARRPDDRVVHVGVARPAARRLPAGQELHHVAAHRAGRRVLRERAQPRARASCAGPSPARPRTSSSAARGGRRRRPGRRSSPASCRGSTARSSDVLEAGDHWFVLGRVRSTSTSTTPTSTRSCSSAASSAASSPVRDARLGGRHRRSAWCCCCRVR